MSISQVAEEAEEKGGKAGRWLVDGCGFDDFGVLYETSSGDHGDEVFSQTAIEAAADIDRSAPSVGVWAPPEFFAALSRQVSIDARRAARSRALRIAMCLRAEVAQVHALQSGQPEPYVPLWREEP